MRYRDRWSFRASQLRKASAKGVAGFADPRARGDGSPRGQRFGYDLDRSGNRNGPHKSGRTPLSAHPYGCGICYPGGTEASALSTPDRPDLDLGRIALDLRRTVNAGCLQAPERSCSAAILSDEDVVYLARVAGRRILSFALQVGTRLPAYRTSMG